ncbi:lantibiotic dehydratase [Pedobacter antarcticus]|uniref:lantibiotic dehydratase n=1 Tax=Pedobacter antarcticus TaxID=34086 RepID=UPI00292DDE49|nr:lantibiotic dehydratase [Pedobacter antarcticus]
MSTSIQFYDKLIVRTPRLHLASVDGELQAMLEDNVFMEAVYMASPSLHQECLKYKKLENFTEKDRRRLHVSLLKYQYRMATRPTPFGLFSGCHVSSFIDGHHGITLDEHHIDTHSRLDMEYICTLIRHLVNIPEVRRQLVYFSNNSICKIGNDWRYVEYTCKNNKRHYQVSEVIYQEFLSELFQRGINGITVPRIQQLLKEDAEGYGDQEIDAFIDELIDVQLLISELEPTTIGEDHLKKIVEVMDRIVLHDVALLSLRLHLHEISELLIRIDQHEIGRMDGLTEIVRLVKLIGIPFEEAKLFHTDLYRKQVSGGLNPGVKDQLTNAVTLLNKLTPVKENSNLKNFREKFYSRYEDKELPLLQVLDTENGIGYVDSSGNQDVTPLIDDVVLTSSGSSAKPMYWNNIEQMLHEKMLTKKGNTITLTDADITDSAVQWNNLPASLPVVFRMLEDNQIYVESCGGSSAVNLLGRFTEGNKEISDIVSDIVAKEQAQEPNILFAEVVHLPENRLGNILFHPPFRAYEIPYIALPSKSDAKTIALSDLYISIRNNRIVLRSVKLNKEVIPRLSNAHNFGKNPLPVYQFLCDLQCQGRREGLHFSWGSLRKIYTCLPRVNYGNIILSLAQWNFTQLHAKELLSLEGEEKKQALLHFRERWLLPREVFIAEGDNELYIDLENALLVNVWLERIKKTGYTLLKEYIAPDQSVTNTRQKRYANQFIAILQQNASTYANILSPTLINPLVKRSFTTGSEWLYYKIYCGVRSADKILMQLVKPVCEELEDAGILNKWFFIRYNDPDFHLRVRFNAKNVQDIGQIIQIFNIWAEPLQENGLIWKIQNDTYNRELERYGSNSIGLVEDVFNLDSKAVIHMIHAVHFEESENFRWMWAMKSIDELYNSFGLSLKDKFRLTDKFRESFSREFTVDRNLKGQLDHKYRQHRARMERWLTNEGLLLEDPDELSAIRCLFERTKEIMPIVFALKALESRSAMEVSGDALIGSLVHMAINRVITSKPRLHELIIYDLMSRLYQSRLARQKYGSLVKKNSDYFAVPKAEDNGK